MRKLSLFFCALLTAGPAMATTVDTKAGYAYMIDYDSGTILLDKQAEVQMHPSSMSKMMTLYVLFSRMKEGRVKPTDLFTVSEKAWKMEGSRMFVQVGTQVKVEDLINGIIIDSGNDACVTVAEGVAGSEAAFAEEMNAAAAKIGLKNSHFVNATGLPDPHHLMTAQDLATLAQHLISDFPDYYHYFSGKSFTYNNITQENRNLLDGNDIGVDGLKTGHTDEAGYGITLSAKDAKPKEAGGGRRLVLVINGLPSAKDRIEEGDRLLRWGMREFTDKQVAKAGQPIAEAEVWFGASPRVKLASAKDVFVTMPVSGADKTTFTVKYNGPLAAPVAKGAPVGELVIAASGLAPVTVPLVAAEDAPKASGFDKILQTLNFYIFHHP